MPPQVPPPGLGSNPMNLNNRPDNKAFFKIGNSIHEVEVLQEKTTHGKKDLSKIKINGELVQIIQSAFKRLIREGIYNPKTDRKLYLVMSDVRPSSVARLDSEKTKLITQRLTDKVRAILESIGLAIGRALGRSPSSPLSSGTSSSKDPATASGKSAATSRQQNQSTRNDIRQLVRDVINNPKLLDNTSNRDLILSRLLDAHEVGALPSQKIAEKLESLCSLIDPSKGITGSVQHALLQLSKDYPKSKNLFGENGDPLQGLKHEILEAYRLENKHFNEHDFHQSHRLSFGEHALTEAQSNSDLAPIYTRYIMKALTVLIAKANNESSRIAAEVTNAISSDPTADTNQKIANICEDTLNMQIHLTRESSASSSQVPPATSRPTLSSSAVTQRTTKPSQQEKKAPSGASASPVIQALPRTAAPQRSNPSSNFIVEKGAGGDCATLSILHQLQQRGIKRSNGDSYNSQKEVRTMVSTYIHDNIRTLANNEQIMTAIESSLRDTQHDGVSLPPQITSILRSSTVYSDNDKQQLLAAYADKIKTDRFWLDKGFFEIAATALKTQIVIIRHQVKSSQLEITERFPRETINTDNALFIYFNGTTGFGGVGGNHYQSIDLNQKEKLSSLVAEDRRKTIRNFIAATQSEKQKKDNIPLLAMSNSIKAAEHLSELPVSLQRHLEDLRNQHPDAYNAVSRIVNTQINRQINLTELPPPDVIDILCNLTQTQIENNINSSRQ